MAWIIAARALLDLPLRIRLSDGRVITGRFTCLDKQRNLLLTDTHELLPKGADESGAGVAPSRQSERHLGTVLVPRRHIVSCQARADAYT